MECFLGKRFFIEDFLARESLNFVNFGIVSFLTKSVFIEYSAQPCRASSTNRISEHIKRLGSFLLFVVFNLKVSNILEMIWNRMIRNPKLAFLIFQIR